MNVENRMSIRLTIVLLLIAVLQLAAHEERREFISEPLPTTDDITTNSFYHSIHILGDSLTLTLYNTVSPDIYVDTSTQRIGHYMYHPKGSDQLFATGVGGGGVIQGFGRRIFRQLPYHVREHGGILLHTCVSPEISVSLDISQFDRDKYWRIRARLDGHMRTADGRFERIRITIEHRHESLEATDSSFPYEQQR